jgi:hypothetical protein
MDSAGAQLQSQNVLEVKFANNVAESYTVRVNSDEKYTITQSYSWIRDENSRYNLVSYSIDGEVVEIPRKARGSFSLDVPMESMHTVIFFTTIQYPISASIDGTDTSNFIRFEPSSPTKDNWFDINTQVAAVIPYNVVQQDQYRKQLVRWAIDTSSTKEISNLESTEFVTPTITTAGPHSIEFYTKEQYYLEVISEHGTIIGDGWYDSGKQASISIIPTTTFPIHYIFDGSENAQWTRTDSYSTTVVMDSPKTIVAGWTADYSQLLIVIGAVSIVAVGMFVHRRRMGKKLTQPKAELTIANQSMPSRMVATPNVSVSLPSRQYPQIEVKPEHNEKAIGDSYAREIMDFATTKSIEALESLHSLGLVPDSRLTAVRQKLEQSF